MDSQKVGFFEEAPGVSSNTRLLVTAIIFYAIFSSFLVLCSGLYQYLTNPGSISLLAIVSAAGGYLTTVCGVAGGWKVMQKDKEQQINSTPQN